MEKEKSINHIITMPQSVRDLAEVAGREYGLSFSAYVRQLIIKDVKKSKQEENGKSN